MLVDPEAQAGVVAEPAAVENGAAPDGQGTDPAETHGALSASSADEEEYTILVPTTDMSTATVEGGDGGDTGMGRGPAGAT